ncbi:tRNA epoxyqueuosine(34) reductase QueG [Microaerobacter geothermalis]|uniref:tRNA epoxyqueuosine(34) reductase QueG n=1 Tax=Microaerobacter geothermalis TaxID=674972 RepID=UPI001F1F93BA|nr:tRNA epoxyqueuosine(34) reductase QueG [Microaerobacter geothermalis]MCF6094596.1 tRNA epoxyqueuosine(34) reductase QueG [Microaerobacter geothermalis]
MNWTVLKDEIKKYAKEIGIDKVGVASADPFLELKERLIKHREFGYESGFEEKDIEKRTHPELTMEDVRSMISIAIAYPSILKDPPRSVPGNRRGMVSRAAWGLDYHHVLREKLSLLSDFIMEKVPEAITKSMVDTGALSDRAVAERAGLGWVGKNCSLITPEFGSWVYLGELLTNLPLPPDIPIEDQCGECNACIEACPTSAFVQPGQLNSQRCLAYITQVKDDISEEFREKLGNRLYGCDTCQQVCPKNRKMNFTHQEAFHPDPDLAKPPLIPLLSITKGTFKNTFGSTAAAWRGKKPIQRNAIIALAHFKDPEAIPELTKVMTEDIRPVMRKTAAWALGKIGGSDAETALKKQLKKEEDETVRREIEKSLEQINKKKILL